MRKYKKEKTRAFDTREKVSEARAILNTIRKIYSQKDQIFEDPANTTTRCLFKAKEFRKLTRN